MSECWRVDQDTRLHYRQWGEDYVVYHEQSGDTHMFDQSGIEILSFLEKNTATTVEILAYLFDATGIEFEVDQLQEMLANLSRHGLIQKVT